MVMMKVHVLHTGEVRVSPYLPFGGDNCNLLKASGMTTPKEVSYITYYLSLLKILLIVSVASGVRSCSFSDFTMWSVPCLYFWKWAVWMWC